MMVAILSHEAHDIHDKFIQSGAICILPKQGSVSDHIKHHTDIVVLVALNLFSYLFLEICILLEELVEDGDFHFSDDHGVDCNDTTRSTKVSDCTDFSEVFTHIQLINNLVVLFVFLSLLLIILLILF